MRARRAMSSPTDPQERKADAIVDGRAWCLDAVEPFLLQICQSDAPTSILGINELIRKLCEIGLRRGRQVELG